VLPNDRATVARGSASVRSERARRRAAAWLAAASRRRCGRTNQARARAEASETPSDAAQRALGVLDQVPLSRLRATAHTRLGRLEWLLAARPAEYVADLRERLRTLPPPVDASGAALA
jgi:hypothetical protein